jgi:predicted porin
MKKHLIAAAVAAAVAVPAMAQVKVSGNLEVSQIVKDNSDGATTNSSSSGSMVGTPHIKFSGSEDLGGGLKAGFTLQMDLETTTGAAIDSTNTASVATIDLSGAFGTVRAGRFDAVGRDAGGVYRFFGDLGRLESSGTPGGNLQSHVAYISPSFGGVQVAGGVSRAGGVTSATARGADVSSVLVRYSAGPLKVAYGSVNSKGAVTAATGTRSDTSVDLIAAGYDFGMAKLGIARMNYDDLARTTNNVTGTVVNVAVPMGKYSVGFGVQKYSNDSDSTSKTDMLTAVAKYDFSKRTALVAAWQQSKGAAGGIATGFDGTRGMGVTATTGVSSSGYGLSVVHNF